MTVGNINTPYPPDSHRDSPKGEGAGKASRIVRDGKGG